VPILYWNARHQTGAQIIFDRLYAWQGLRCCFGRRSLLGIFDDAPESDIAVAHGDVNQDRIELVPLQQDFHQFVAKLPVLRCAGFMMIDDRVRKPVQQVGAADDTHKPAVAEHRYALDVMALAVRRFH